jgi:hypothetical protein
MPEPITLALVGGAVLTEGIKFLYGQATEALKRWRDHKDAAPKPETVPATGEVPAIFEGTIAPLQIHLDKVGELERQLKAARAALSDYNDGLETVTSDNTALLEKTDALRQMMEAVYQYRLTFQGEDRPASGPEVIGSAEVETIKGLVAGVQAGRIESGTVRGTVKAKTVDEGGQAFGVKADRIG